MFHLKRKVTEIIDQLGVELKWHQIVRIYLHVIWYDVTHIPFRFSNWWLKKFYIKDKDIRRGQNDEI